MSYDSTIDTTLHINRVHSLLGQCAITLLERGARHDASKLEEPEKAIFDAVGNRLAIRHLSGCGRKTPAEFPLSHLRYRSEVRCKSCRGRRRSDFVRRVRFRQSDFG